MVLDEHEIRIVIAIISIISHTNQLKRVEGANFQLNST